MKLFYFKEQDRPINYFNTSKQIEVPEEYIEKKVRAFWVSTVANIDLPILTDEKQYKKELDKIVETAIDYNINTIYFQVRPLNDAFYKSKLNPTSRYLMGEEGKEMPFDVLSYLIDISSRANIEVHAWCNPYRVSKPFSDTKEAYLESLDDLNFAKRRPDLVITDNTKQLILNPTSEEVKDFITESMIEIVANYDVKGIHWDDYFYPYAPLSDDDNDLENYNNRSDKTMDLAAFRRYHVTDVIRKVYEGVKSVNKDKVFGVSPFGIWRGIENDPRGSNTGRTSQSYDSQYADSYEWVKKGYIDYIVPQLYWFFGHETAPIADLVKWWSELVSGTNVELYIGHPAYRQGEKGEFENPLEVVNQVKYANSYKEVSGNVFFTFKNFLEKDVNKEGMKNLRKLLRNEDV